MKAAFNGEIKMTKKSPTMSDKEKTENLEESLTSQQWALMVGQKVQYGANEKDLHQAVCIGISQEFLELVDDDDADENPYLCHMNICKPILRTIDQLTEDETAEFDDFNHVRIGKRLIDSTGFIMHALNVDWLTQKGIDIRGWIDKGLAVSHKEEK